jgi:hypothetical protein
MKTNKIKLIGILALSFVMLFALTACDSTTAPTPGEETHSATFTVVADNGNPVEDANVILEDTANAPAAAMLNGTTDAEGKVTLTGLTADEYSYTITYTDDMELTGTFTKAQAGDGLGDFKFDAAKSIYAFEFEEELTAVANEDITTDMTFKAIENLGEGYDDVIFNFGVKGPDDGIVTFTATDSAGDEIPRTVATGYTGVWGPEDGFTVKPNYDATTKWTLNFSKAGEYTIIFSLVYVGGEIDPGITGSVTVTVTEAE